MEKNKSIDGLSVRSAKKAEKKPKTIKVEVEVEEPEKAETEILEQINDEAVEDFLKPVRAFELDEGGELEEAKEPIEAVKPKKKAKKEKKKVSKLRKIITSILLIIVLAMLGLITWAVFWGNDIIAKITGGNGNLWDAIGVITAETYETLKTDANGRTNILAFGTSGYNMEGDEGKGVHAGAQLTDSIMMISINQETGDIAMLSLPRDLKASPTCTATGKINEVYWCHNRSGNDEAGGAQALMREVGSILGVDFQYYAHLNWGSLVQIVDALGGITVTLDEDINDYYYTGAVFQAGVPYNINGEQALGLARARHGTEGGDFSRGNSQQKILIGIKDKIYETNLPLMDMLGLVSVLGDNLRTNLSLSEIKTAAHLTFEFDLESIRQLSLSSVGGGANLMTTGTINGISYVLPRAGVGNYKAIQEYVANNLIVVEENTTETTND